MLSECRDLHFEVLEQTLIRQVLTLTQYVRIPSLGALPAPSITIAVYISEHSAEALCYESFIKRKWVYSESTGQVDLKAKRDLNTFLDGWLKKLLDERIHVQ